MALQTDFGLDGIIYHNCYLKIIKVRTQVSEYEFFEVVSDDPTIAEKLSWESRVETAAHVNVWIDDVSRSNRALPLKTFSFEFDYDLKSDRNIYQQGYDSLKATEQFADAVDV